jgi:hypothetical protein
MGQSEYPAIRLLTWAIYSASNSFHLACAVLLRVQSFSPCFPAINPTKHGGHYDAHHRHKNAAPGEAAHQEKLLQEKGWDMKQ